MECSLPSLLNKDMPLYSPMRRAVFLVKLLPSQTLPSGAFVEPAWKDLAFAQQESMGVVCSLACHQQDLARQVWRASLKLKGLGDEI